MLTKVSAPKPDLGYFDGHLSGLGLGAGLWFRKTGIIICSVAMNGLREPVLPPIPGPPKSTNIWLGGTSDWQPSKLRCPETASEFQQGGQGFFKAQRKQNVTLQVPVPTPNKPRHYNEARAAFASHGRADQIGAGSAVDTGLLTRLMVTGSFPAALLNGGPLYPCPRPGTVVL